MRRIRIQKRRPTGLANEQLQGGWNSVQALSTKVATAPLSNDERIELEQRRRLYTLIREHAVA
jgi:hypothetical protein